MSNTDMSFFGLNRPEYVPLPELALSELIWSTVPDSLKEPVRNLSTRGLAYGTMTTRPAKGIEYTKPAQGSDQFDKLSSATASLFGKDTTFGNEITSQVLSEIEVLGGPKAKSSAVSPLTLPLALLQDRKGITNKSNPANIAAIIEQIFALGAGSETAAKCLLDAYKTGGSSGLPVWLQDLTPIIPPPEVQNVVDAVKTGVDLVQPKAGRNLVWLSRQKNTPFNWFSNAWHSLCCGGWINEMPRRRWTDWATCLTRTGIASTYLFEMHVTYKLVTALSSPAESPEDIVREMLEESNRLLVWDERKSRSMQNVGPVLKQLAANGAACQKCLVELKAKYPNLPAPSEFDHLPDGLERWLTAARKALSPQQGDVRLQVAAALDERPPSSANNVWETVRYSLLNRGGEQSLDLYSLLQAAGPSTWVEPGQEWLVTIASLCSRGPGQPTRLAALNSALLSIGLSPAPTTIVPRLEAYGLCRSSHDADDAVELQPAF